MPEAYYSIAKKKIIASVFDDFVRKFLNPTERFYSVSDVPTIYDYIVFGSDQIWNPTLCGGFDDAFWGQFPKGRMKFVAYAASIGNTLLFDEKKWNEVGERIKAFDYISVRELQLKNIIEQRFAISVSHCIDPTLLVGSEVFEKLVIPPHLRDYIFVYNVQIDDHSEAFAEFLAKQYGCKVVIGQAKPRLKSIKRNKDTILIDSASPEKFLGYIKNARLVIGNSFHVIALSIVFRKDFYSLDSKKAEKVGSKGFEYIWKQEKLLKLSNIKPEEIISNTKENKHHNKHKNHHTFFLSTCKTS